MRVWLLLAIMLTCLAFTAFIVSCKTGDDDDDDSVDDTAASDDAFSDDAGDDDAPNTTDPDVQCSSIEDPESNQACRDCVLKCNQALVSGYDLSQGPCLSEAIDPGWACDIVHSPRISLDDLVQNQCVQYPSISPRKVEVTPDCKFLTLY